MANPLKFHVKKVNISFNIMMMNIFKSTSRFSNSISVICSSLHTSNKKFTLRLEHLNDTIECIENVHDAQTLFHHMLQLKTKPHVSQFHKLLTIIVNMKQYPLAVILFKKMQLLRFPVHEYFMNSMVHSYSQINEFDLSFLVIGSFLKRGFFPDVVTYNCLIRGLFLQRNVEKAVTLFKMLIKNKFEINGYTIPIVLDGLCKSGDIGNACQLLELAERNNWKLGVFGYTAAIDGFCKCGRLEDATKLLLRMIDRNINPDIVTYTTLLHGLCNHKKLGMACSIFSDLPSRGLAPNLVTYNVMIYGLCKGGQFQVAKDVLENMEKKGFVADSVTCCVILDGCIRRCDNFHAINLLKKIVGRDFQLYASTFFVLLRNISKIRQMPGVYDDNIVMQLILKLLSSDERHTVKDSAVINSLIKKIS